jgi:hypothetical protein
VEHLPLGEGHNMKPSFNHYIVDKNDEKTLQDIVIKLVFSEELQSKVHELYAKVGNL